MILADTNVVVDFCGVSAQRIARARSAADSLEYGERLVITEAVLAECFWVLHQSYGWDEMDSAGVLAQIADSSEFVLESEMLRAGLEFKLEHPSLDITDCLLAARVLAGDRLITHDTRLNHAVELALKGCHPPQ